MSKRSGQRQVCPFSPRLRSLSDSYKSDLTVVDMNRQRLSVNDNPLMEPSWFTENGSSIIGKSMQMAMQSAVAATIQGTSATSA